MLPIEVGSMVRVTFSTNGLFSFAYHDFSFDAIVSNIPQATGDLWGFTTQDGHSVLVNPMSSVFIAVELI